MHIQVIIGKNIVFGTYGKTCSFGKKFSTAEEKKEAIRDAKANVFSYACTFGAVHCAVEVVPSISNEQELFSYLEKTIF